MRRIRWLSLQADSTWTGRTCSWCWTNLSSWGLLTRSQHLESGGNIAQRVLLIRRPMMFESRADWRDRT